MPTGAITLQFADPTGGWSLAWGEQRLVPMLSSPGGPLSGSDTALTSWQHDLVISNALPRARTAAVTWSCHQGTLSLVDRPAGIGGGTTTVDVPGATGDTPGSARVSIPVLLNGVGNFGTLIAALEGGAGVSVAKNLSVQQAVVAATGGASGIAGWRLSSDGSGAAEVALGGLRCDLLWGESFPIQTPPDTADTLARLPMRQYVVLRATLGSSFNLPAIELCYRLETPGQLPPVAQRAQVDFSTATRVDRANWIEVPMAIDYLAGDAGTEAVLRVWLAAAGRDTEIALAMPLAARWPWPDDTDPTHPDGRLISAALDLPAEIDGVWQELPGEPPALWLARARAAVARRLLRRYTERMPPGKEKELTAPLIGDIDPVNPGRVVNGLIDSEGKLSPNGQGVAPADIAAAITAEGDWRVLRAARVWRDSGQAAVLAWRQGGPDTQAFQAWCEAKAQLPGGQAVARYPKERVAALTPVALSRLADAYRTGCGRGERLCVSPHGLVLLRQQPGGISDPWGAPARRNGSVSS